MGVKELRTVSKVVTVIFIWLTIFAFYKVKTWEDTIEDKENPLGSQYTIMQKNEIGGLSEYKIIVDSLLNPEDLKAISESIVSEGIKTDTKKNIIIKMYVNKKEFDGTPTIAEVKYDFSNKKYTIIPYVDSLK